jgi:hypothetical protein
MLKIIIKAILSLVIVIVIVTMPILTSRVISLDVEKQSFLNMDVGLQKSVETSKYSSLLATVLDDFEVNEERADSAPKQTVVALWAIKDIDSISLLANEELLNQINNNFYNLNKNIAEAIVSQNITQVVLFYLLISFLVIAGIFTLFFIWKEEINSVKK